MFQIGTSSKGKIHYLLLMLDEADEFFDSCEAVYYAPFNALKDIQLAEPGRFKFVVARLRNVVRFKNKAAIGGNSVLPHLDSITVKPFTTLEARMLLRQRMPIMIAALPEYGRAAFVIAFERFFMEFFGSLL